MKTVKLNAFDNPFVYGIDNKEYLVFNIDNETQTLKFQSLIGDLKVKTANILFKANSLPAKLYEMVVDDDILTFTLPSVLTGYNSSMYVYLLLNYSDDLSTSDLYTFKLVNKGSSTFNFEISSICESNISTIVSEEIKNEGIAKSILDAVSNYEFDKLQHAQQSLSLVQNAFASTLEKRIDLFNSAYDKANEIKSNTTGDINDSDIDIPDSNTDSDLKDYVENVKKQMAERLKDVTAVSQQIQDEMTQEKQSFLGASLIFQQDLKQDRDIISAYGESTRQHMDQEFNEVKDHADKVFADFSKNIPDLDASIKQVNDKIVATDNKVGTLNTKVTNVENDITELEKMHDEVTQTINNGKPINLYSNSLEFGEYDYSGNPNLSSKLNASSFSSGTGATVTDDNDEIVFTLDGADQLSKYAIGAQTSLIKGKQYTISCEIMLEDGFTGDPSGIRLQHVFFPGGSVVLMTTTEPKNELNKWQKLVGTQTAEYTSATPNEWYPVFTDIRNLKPTGKVRLRNIKIEEGATATPYQPNLLDKPYYLSKIPLGENIADPTGIISTSYLLLSKGLKEKIIEGQTYTITLKGNKPSTQTFRCFVEYESGTSAVNLFDMKPVEGLTDEWELTFKATRTAKGINGAIYVYQVPNTSLGQCKIDWFKVEKGDTRTPNIESYKYKGVSLRNTIDPRAFDWQEQTVADVSKLKEKVNTLTPKVDNSQLFKLTKDDGTTIKVDYMNPKPTSFLALAKNTGFYSISTAEAKLMSDYSELPTVLQNTFLFINNYPSRDGFIIQEITGGELSTQLVHKYYRRIEPDGTYKNWNKVITDKDVSKMKTLYSNCIDFGNYDYSGNPNLMPYITDPWVGSLLANGNTVKDSVKRVITHTKTRTADAGDVLSLGLGIPRAVEANNRYLITVLRPSTPYTLTVTMSVGSDWTGKTNTIGARVIYLNESGGTETPINVLLPANVERDKMITHTFTGTTKADLTGMKNCYVQIFSVNSEDKGTVSVSYDVKLEIGTIATPYQPNLLDKPYYLSKVPLGKNLVKNAQFPIRTLNNPISEFDILEELVIGETYTVSLKGFKPANKEFQLYYGDSNNFQVTLHPVEGLIDVWSATFKARNATGTSNLLRVALWQMPTTVTNGPVQIDWLKIEKGDTRTPNIDEYKYKGFSVKLSNNPNDYEWSIDRQYGEKRLDKMVNTTDPQSIGGIKNFLETPLVKGKEVLYGDRLFEGFYDSGILHSSIKTKARLGVGGLVMDDQPRLPEPFEWNSGRWQATVIRDVTFYCEGTMYIDTGANMGKYIYIANWKDDAQTQYASGNPAGMGIAADNGYWYRNLKDFSWIVSLKKGDKFSIGIELAADKEVWNIQIRTLHIKELIPPL
jgi:hypothetical protein|nr:MAG TPA: Minor structural protein adsorption, WTA interaction, caudovirales.2A [Caudoviricetes sp.]